MTARENFQKLDACEAARETALLHRATRLAARAGYHYSQSDEPPELMIDEMVRDAIEKARGRDET